MMVLHLVLARLLPKNTKRFGIGASIVHMNSEAPSRPLLHLDFFFLSLYLKFGRFEIDFYNLFGVCYEVITT